MKGRSRSAGPEVPSWAVPPARCSWADPAPGGGKPGAVRALPLSSLGQSRSARPFPAGAGVLFRPQSPWPGSRKPDTSLRVLSRRMRSAVPFAPGSVGLPPNPCFGQICQNRTLCFSPLAPAIAGNCRLLIISPSADRSFLERALDTIQSPLPSR